jgi:PIN domain nuclease of toxin-antitoxin system
MADFAAVLFAIALGPHPFHGDSADRIIVATARHENAVPVTSDGRMRCYSYVRSLW